MEEDQTNNDVLKKFDYRITKIEPHVISLLSEIDEIRGVYKVSVKMTSAAILKLRKSVLITSTGASTRIEGSKMTDEEVRELVKNFGIQKFEDRDKQEVAGYHETLNNIFESYEKLELREGTILHLQKELLKYSTKDSVQRGHYKTKENIVGVLGPNNEIVKIVFETTLAWLTPKEMTELLDWTYIALERKRFHPLLIIANFIIEFLKIHPFEDGNGRTSRLLTNMLLLKFGYSFMGHISHEEIIERRKDEYYLALRNSQATFKTDNENIYPWLNFFLGVIKEQGTRALENSKVDAEVNTSPKQEDVIRFFENVNEASPLEISKGTGMLLPSVRKSLKRLIELGIVKQIGKGRGTRYIKI